MLEGQCQCINDIDIHKRAKYTRADKYDRMDALYFQQDQVTQVQSVSVQMGDGTERLEEIRLRHIQSVPGQDLAACIKASAQNTYLWHCKNAWICHGPLPF